jgi:histidinol dehydrogenase
MRSLDWTQLNDIEKKSSLTRPAEEPNPILQDQVRSILNAVREGGDDALQRFSLEYDNVPIQTFRVPFEALEQSWKDLSPSTREALEQAKANINRFHAGQYPTRIEIETMPGVRCSREWRPLETVGFYVPGGSAPLVSTVLMLALPSVLAGNRRRILCSPPQGNGLPHPLILAAAYLCDIHETFSLGGAQAIAAMACGTSSIPRVDKIFGPGNAWVTEAKTQVASLGVAIDMPAGPSELMVLADDTAVAAFVAADLLSQAEHGPDSQVILVSSSPGLSLRVLDEVTRQLSDLPRQAIARKALQRSVILNVPDVTAGMEIVNRYAPEHLILQTKDPERLVAAIHHAGSVFLGPWSPESAGDYASGSNHVLPTYGYARQTGGLTLESFMKTISFQELTRDGLAGLAPTLEELARVEGLEAHRRAVSLRLNSRF